MALKVKLHTINNSSYKSIFECSNFCNVSEFITGIVMVDNKKEHKSLILY